MHPRPHSLIGEIVRAERERQGLTQDDLGLAAGVSYRTVLQIERGKPTSRIDVLVRVVEALGLRLEVRASPRSLSGAGSVPLGQFRITSSPAATFGWELLQTVTGQVIARSSDEYPSRTAALDAIRELSAIAADRTLDNVELYSQRRVHYWRLEAPGGRALAESGEPFASRRAAARAANHALLIALSAEVV